MYHGNIKMCKICKQFDKLDIRLSQYLPSARHSEQHSSFQPEVNMHKNSMRFVYSKTHAVICRLLGWIQEQPFESIIMLYGINYGNEIHKYRITNLYHVKAAWIHLINIYLSNFSTTKRLEIFRSQCLQGQTWEYTFTYRIKFKVTYPFPG